MQLSINTITVETDNGAILCSVAKVFLAVSTTVAIQLIPIDDNGVEYPEHSISVVGGDNDEATAGFMVYLTNVVANYLLDKGI